ncbi:MAG: EamA family transporter, partial [Hyphomicrobiaceae bacterium]
AGMALATGCFIAGYSLVDGLGARIAGTAVGFYAWLTILNAVVFVALMRFIQPGLLQRVPGEGGRLMLIGGGASFLAYALVIWAFTQAPIALVTALRETSILFALAIGVVFLKERLAVGKVVALTIATAGVVLLRAGR